MIKKQNTNSLYITKYESKLLPRDLKMVFNRRKTITKLIP